MQIAEIKVSYCNPNKERIKINQSKQAFEIVNNTWNQNTIELQEEFKIILLNRNNQILGIYPLSKGGTATTTVNAKLVFSVALKCNATSLILVHNHTSGNLKPSKSDIGLTKKIKEGASLLDLVVLDHLIISKENFYSLADNADM